MLALQKMWGNSMSSNSCNTNDCTKVLEKVIINIWVSILCFFRGIRDPKDWYVLFFDVLIFEIR
jgi:hypothetical protein